MAAGSGDNGITWTRTVKLTDANSSSHRYPCIIDCAIPGDPDCDTVAVLYMDDQVAGATIVNVGPATFNPVLVRKVAVDEFPLLGVEGPDPTARQRAELELRPSVTSGVVRISYVVTQTGDMSLTIHDACGRLASTLDSGRRTAGRYSLMWNPSGVARGVYILTLESSAGRTSRQVVITE
jgi:hypothetical protein